MNLEPLSRKLRSQFRKVYYHAPSGDAILIPKKPYCFDMSLFDVATTEEEKWYVENELEIYADSTEMTMNAETCFLDHLGISERFFLFYWQSSGPCAFDASLQRLDFKDGCSYFAFRDEERYRVIAAVSAATNKELIRKFFYKFISTNGMDFGVEIFGSLPSGTENNSGGIVSKELVAKAYFDWLEADFMNGKEEKWALLREEVVSKLVEPDVMTRSLATLDKFKAILGNFDEYIKNIKDEGEDLRYDDKVRILANYFEMAYHTGPSPDSLKGDRVE